MTPALQYTFRIDAAETVRASRAVRRRGRGWWLQWAVWPMLVGLAMLYRLAGHPWRDLWLLGVTGCFLGTLIVLALWLERRQLRRAYRELPGAAPQVYEFTESGLHLHGGALDTSLQWGGVVAASETPEFFLFFFRSRQAFYLPKRAVGSAAEQHRLREFIRAQLGPRAAGLAPS